MRKGDILESMLPILGVFQREAILFYIGVFSWDPLQAKLQDMQATNSLAS